MHDLDFSPILHGMLAGLGVGILAISLLTRVLSLGLSRVVVGLSAAAGLCALCVWLLIGGISFFGLFFALPGVLGVGLTTSDTRQREVVRRVAIAVGLGLVLLAAAGHSAWVRSEAVRDFGP